MPRALRPLERRKTKNGPNCRYEVSKNKINGRDEDYVGLEIDGRPNGPFHVYQSMSHFEKNRHTSLRAHPALDLENSNLKKKTVELTNKNISKWR